MMSIHAFPLCIGALVFLVEIHESLLEFVPVTFQALAEAGLIAPHTTRFDLDDAATALEKLAAVKITGRAVVVPG